MVWTLTHHPPGDRPSRDYRVQGDSLDAAIAKLARALRVPEWTIRRPTEEIPA
ncbi:MAG: hypothetical protein OXC28_04980 [Defluviicoccus sp.]|nr:hypothetical protein [Defluviicoccus sp.]